MLKNTSILLFIFTCFSCSVTKDAPKTPVVDPSTVFNIVKTTITTESDPIDIDELRFYKIQSALDGVKLMYLNYGEWSQKSEGKYQPNIKQFTWENVKLLDIDETFTVIADGTETGTEYFASLIIFDSNQQNCLTKTHPLREQVIKLFVSKMKNLTKDSSVYKKFK